MGLAPASKVVPAVLAFLPLGYAVDEFIHWASATYSGGKMKADMPTLDGKWKEMEKIRLLNMEREGAPDEPVLMNPFRRGLPATVRNAEQLAEFGKN
ncbi:hypothetical protein WJX81_008685 [Elliptochloris bilobata]|uniref:Uncharacterized protein n=1 Tax=Elliptochloris bilobata TaxID=381761 RepID=A0AAW1R4G7_9CHLO